MSAFHGDGSLVKTEIKGLYGLPDKLLLDPYQLTLRYQAHVAEKIARRSPVTYVKYLFAQLRTAPGSENSHWDLHIIFNYLK